MKRALILSLFLAATVQPVFCETTFFPPLQPVNQTNAIQDYGNSITSVPDPFVGNSAPNYNDINRIEQSLFGRTYDNQNINLRLGRIEKSLFTTTYPSAPAAQRIDNIISNFNQMNKYPNISQNALTKMETKVFGQNFPQNNQQKRIERLEQKIFGAVQSGDMDSRYEALKIAMNTYNKNIANGNYQMNYNNAPQKGWRGVTNALGGNFMGGTMTGFTPPITPYYGNNMGAYGNPFAGLGSGFYRGYGSNNGLGGYRYMDQYSNYGSGTGVTILD